MSEIKLNNVDSVHWFRSSSGKTILTVKESHGLETISREFRFEPGQEVLIQHYLPKNGPETFNVYYESA